ncbi:MAG: hypothetical protein IT307_09225 [Chloroflexi bacterium]|nr:hypothetical protein [Chloroflexota bacterium]
MLAYFQSHGAELTLGYPTSREMRLRGEWLQLFQRSALRRRDDGTVEAVDLPSDRYLPIRRLNGAVLPATDDQLVAASPDASAASGRLEAWLRATVPDEFEGERVNFRRAFSSLFGTVNDIRRGADLFGVPASRPARDPVSGAFVYQRFQRAVFQYDTGTGQTSALLLGEYLKALLTGQGLPPDLAQDLSGSPFLRQYSSVASDGLQRPWELPDSDLANAFLTDTAVTPRALVPDGFGPETGWPTGTDDDGAVSRDDGDYVIRTQRPGTPDEAVSVRATNGQVLGDFELVVDCRLSEPQPRAGYAIQLRGASDDWVSMVVDADRGLLAAYRVQGTTRRWLLEWTPIPGHRSSDQPDRFSLRAVAGGIAGWANGTPVFDVPDGGPAYGQLWLAAVSWGEPAAARFSGLRVVALTGGA